MVARLALQHFPSLDIYLTGLGEVFPLRQRFGHIDCASLCMQYGWSSWVLRIVVIALAHPN